MQRRRVLSAAGTGIVMGVAGCLDGGPTSGEGETNETDSESDPNGDEQDNDSTTDVGESDDGESDAGGDDSSGDESTDDSSGEDDTGGEAGDDGDAGDGETDDAGDGDGGDDPGQGDDGEDEDSSQGDDEESEAGEGDGDAGDENGDDQEGAETHTLTVTVVDRTAEVPLEGTVAIAGETRETGADGEVTYELPADSYTVTASSEVYQDSVITVDLQSDESISIGLVPAEAELDILDHELSRESVSGEEAYVVRGTVANTGKVASEDVVIEIVLYDSEGRRLHERYSAPIEMPAESEQSFEFTAMYGYHSAFDDVDPDRYEVAVFSYVGHRRLARAGSGSSRFSLGGVLGGLFS